MLSCFYDADAVSGHMWVGFCLDHGCICHEMDGCGRVLDRTTRVCLLVASVHSMRVLLSVWFSF